LPNRLFNDFNIISKLFGKNRVFLEMTIPIILSGIDRVNNENLYGFYSWNGEQTNIEKDHYQIEHFSHPFKLFQYGAQYKRSSMCRNLIIFRIRINKCIIRVIFSMAVNYGCP